MFRLLLAFAVATAGHSAPSTFVSGENYVHNLEVIEHTGAGAPQLIVVGGQTENVKADDDASYTDYGALCSDSVDGFINSDIEVSGDVVNMAVPKAYKIVYTCTNSQGKVGTSVKTVNVLDAASFKKYVIAQAKSGHALAMKNVEQDKATSSELDSTNADLMRAVHQLSALKSSPAARKIAADLAGAENEEKMLVSEQDSVDAKAGIMLHTPVVSSHSNVRGGGGDGGYSRSDDDDTDDAADDDDANR
jgi:hypothetical protein